MAIVRLDPFRELAVMQDRINRIFGDTYRRGDDDLMQRGDWIPPVDIFENDKHELVITAELPGLTREAIDILLENNMLTIRGERKKASETTDEQFHRVERAYGVFSRSFSLPATVDVNKVWPTTRTACSPSRCRPARSRSRGNIQVQVNG